MGTSKFKMIIKSTLTRGCFFLKKLKKPLDFRIMAGQLRENANPDINYDQEARLFGIVVMAMSLFFDK